MRYIIILIVLFSTKSFAKTIHYSNCISGKVAFTQKLELTNNREDYKYYKPGEYKVTKKLFKHLNKIYVEPKSKEAKKMGDGYWYYQNESYSKNEWMYFTKDQFKELILDKKARPIKRIVRDIYSVNTSAGTITHTYEYTPEYFAYERDSENRQINLNKSKGIKIKGYETPFFGSTIKRLQINNYKIDKYGGGLIIAYDIKDERFIDRHRQAIKIDLLNHTITLGYLKALSDGEDFGWNIKKTCMLGFDADNDQKKRGGSGTAFFINSGGNLVTNNHVIENCSKLNVSFNNKQVPVSVLNSDENLDLAVLKSDIRPKSFISLSKNSSNKLQDIFAAGYPLGKGLSDDLKITSGIVSSIKGFRDNVNQIQIDAAINPGSSGGPIVNKNGYLVGVSVASLDKSKTESVNFGVKSSSLEQFLNVNEIKYSKPLYEFSSNKNSLRRLLENSTVYIACIN